jgi:hypothetical protein
VIAAHTLWGSAGALFVGASETDGLGTPAAAVAERCVGALLGSLEAVDPPAVVHPARIAPAARVRSSAPCIVPLSRVIRGLSSQIS